MRYLLVFIFMSFQFFDLNSETVLITGANRGIGLEFARQYRNLGYAVIGTARSPDQAKELKALGVRIEQLDVTDLSGMRWQSELESLLYGALFPFTWEKHLNGRHHEN